MNFQSIKVPFLTKGEISMAADRFRKKYWHGTIPVDIEKIISVNLRMDIIFKPGLFKLFNIDAYITSSWQQICVDYDLFEADKNNNRLRFSYAHEIGHLVLHKNLYEQFGIREADDFNKFYNEIPGDQYHFMETQAHIFANFLLIPRIELYKIREKIIKQFISANQIIINEIDPKLLNQYLAGPIAKYFGVSSTPIEIALMDLNK
jgi:Zn-dependent peptidase ImmA (M78 family)